MKRESLAQIEDIELKSCCYTEKRLQKIIPMPDGYYFDRHKHFVETFSRRSDVQTRTTGSVVLVGKEQVFDQILPIITTERDVVTRVAGTEPEKILVFVADGETMENQYRSIGSSSPPYSYAISGALGCCINTDYLKEGLLTPAMERAVRHEPRHALWNLTLMKNGRPTYQIERDTTIYEILGGPLTLGLWSDIETAENIDFTSLDSGQMDFSEWYERNTTTLKHREPYFLNPVTKAFYQWALNQGDVAYWYEKAKAIKT